MPNMESATAKTAVRPNAGTTLLLAALGSGVVDGAWVATVASLAASVAALALGDPSEVADGAAETKLLASAATDEETPAAADEAWPMMDCKTVGTLWVALSVAAEAAEAADVTTSEAEDKAEVTTLEAEATADKASEAPDETGESLVALLVTTGTMPVGATVLEDTSELVLPMTMSVSEAAAVVTVATLDSESDVAAVVAVATLDSELDVAALAVVVAAVVVFCEVVVAVVAAVVSLVTPGQPPIQS